MLQEAEVSCGLTGQTRTQECPEQLCSLSGLWLSHQHLLSTHCMHTGLATQTQSLL